MLTAGARPKSRSDVNSKELALFVVVGLILALPLRLGVDWLVDHSSMSLYNAATVKAVLIFIPLALVLPIFPWRDAAVRSYATNFSFVTALLSIGDSAHRRDFIDLWPAILVTLLMFVAVRKWEQARQSAKSERDR